MSKQVLFLLIATLITSARCDTVMETLNADASFSSFSTLAAPVFASLSIQGSLTVIVPTNDAVELFLARIGFDVSTNIELLKEIIDYHIFHGYYVIANITQFPFVTTLNGTVINITVTSGQILLNGLVRVLEEFPQDDGNIISISDILVPPSLQFLLPTSALGPCFTQECCSLLATPNPETGDGYLEFKSQCLSGGLHCLEQSGCRLCHDGSVPNNRFNRPICNSDDTILIPCHSQECCASRIVPNPETGYGFLEYNESCVNGGLNCVMDWNCQACFNPSFGTSNFFNIPVCSTSAIGSFPTMFTSNGGTQAKRDVNFDIQFEDNAGSILFKPILFVLMIAILA